MKRRYKELIRLETFDERLKYLMLSGQVGADTFGFDRYMNQQFYASSEWKQLRNYVITRDNACDLGSEGHEMYGKILIHHIEPITPDDIKDGNYDKLLNPDNCISTCFDTHQIIHYGFSVPDHTIKDRKPGDTRLW